MRKLAIAFVSGVLFAVGLGLAGMTQPSKVLGFLDFFGTWDPTLAVVMGSALAVDVVAFAWILKRKQPLTDTTWHLPTRAKIDAPLLTGAALFGLGWGLSGVCPGPALVSLTTLKAQPLTFGVAMLAGMGVYHAVEAVRRRAVTSSNPSTLQGHGAV
jgi:uncharacterized membrane protein YedE/YeeE